MLLQTQLSNVLSALPITSQNGVCVREGEAVGEGVI